MNDLNIAILDANTLGSDINFSIFEKFGNVSVYDATDTRQVRFRAMDADVVIVNKIPLNADTLGNVQRLKLICVTATGYDNIDLEFCREKNIAVCNVQGYSSHSVAQVTMAMALSLVNHLPHFDRFVKDGSYTKSGVQNKVEPVFHEMSALTWGIVGLGAIGKRTAQLARAMGCKVLAYNRTSDALYECVSLEELLRKSDIVSLHLPLTDETRHIIGKDELEMMKKTAILINVARGAVIDDEAVTDAIINNSLGGLGVDTYDFEPMSEDSPYNKISDRENVIFTPHMAWGAYESRMRCMEEIVLNIESFLAGGKRNRV